MGYCQVTNDSQNKNSDYENSGFLSSIRLHIRILRSQDYENFDSFEAKRHQFFKIELNKCIKTCIHVYKIIIDKTQ